MTMFAEAVIMTKHMEPECRWDRELGREGKFMHSNIGQL